jgi:nitrate/nitrite transporter NarK
MFPKQDVGSVVGIGGMMGAVGGMIISPLVGLILDNRQLLANIYDRSFGLSYSAAYNPLARSKARTGKRKL